MDKRTPHTKLHIVQKLIRLGAVQFSASVAYGADEVGLRSKMEIVTFLLRIRPTDFYKSMTTYTDSRIWQDVYQPTTASGIKLYVKFTVRWTNAAPSGDSLDAAETTYQQVLLVSFKRNTSGDN